MSVGSKFKRLTTVHTPTDMRGALGTMAHGINWLLPPDPKIEKAVRNAVEAITGDLWAIGPQDQEMIPSFLSSIEEPLEELHKIGFGLSYAVVDDAPAVGNQLIPGWTTTIYVVSEQPLVFVSVDDGVTSPLHLLNACPATERNIIQTAGEGVGVLPRLGFQLGWLDQEESWCPECWKVLDQRRDQLRVAFAPNRLPADDQLSADEVREMLTLHAETNLVEFKETLNWDVRQAAFNDDRLLDVQKAICAMLNRDGGKILIGVRDEGNEPIGIGRDMEKFKTHDAFQRKIAEPFGIKLKPDPSDLVKVRFVEIDGMTLACVDVRPDSRHAFALNDKVYVRRDGESRELTALNLTAWWTRRQRGEE